MKRAQKIEAILHDRRGNLVNATVVKVTPTRKGLKIWMREEVVQRPLPNMSPLEIAEKQVIEKTLKRRRGNKNQTRIELGITVNTLIAKIKKYGLDVRKFK